VILHCAEESQIMPVWLRKMVLAQRNSRVLAQLFPVAGESPQQQLCNCRKERNKYDLTTAQCF